MPLEATEKKNGLNMSPTLFAAIGLFGMGISVERGNKCGLGDTCGHHQGQSEANAEQERKLAKFWLFRG